MRSVCRGRLPAESGGDGDLVEGGDQDALGLGVAGGQEVELRHLIRERAEAEQLVADGRSPTVFLALAGERLDGAAQLVEAAGRQRSRGERVFDLDGP